MNLVKFLTLYKSLIFKGSASLFNLGAVWFIYSIKGNEWSNSYYNLASMCAIASIITRFGYDLFIAYGGSKHVEFSEINLLNMLLLLLGAFIFGIFADRVFFGLSIGAVFVSIALLSLISIFEGLIRAKLEGDQAQLVVLTYSNLFLFVLVLLNDSVTPWGILVVNSFVSLIALAIYFYISGGRIVLRNKKCLDFSSASVVHGIHGLINQQYIVFFMTKYLQEWSMPVIFTVIRVCNLASWPLSYFTFSDVSKKNNNLSDFLNQNLKQLQVAVLSVIFLIVAYMSIIAETRYILPSVIMAVGILTFAVFGFGFFYRINSKRFIYILAFQILMFGFTLVFAELGFITITLLAAVYCLYLIICSFSYRFLPA